MLDQIEPTRRTRHARRVKVVVNGRSRAGSGVTRNALRVVFDRDEVSACSRRVERDGCRIAALRDRLRHTTTVGVKHIAPPRKVEEAAEVPRGDRLRDRERVVAGWRRDPYPVEEHTGVDVLRDLPVADAVIQAAEGLGRAG